MSREPTRRKADSDRHSGEERSEPAAGCGRVALFTLGCKINQYDTNCILSDLKGQGYALTKSMDDADVIVVNTCTVTGKTDYKGRQLVRRAVLQNPGAVVVVTGCYAQVQPEKIAEIPGVDYILGNAEKLEMAAWISTCTKQNEPIIRNRELRETVAMDGGALPAHSGTTRAFLKIQDGCNHSCTYCIIPRARGRSRSLPEDRLLEKVNVLAEMGYREMILCGIHLGAYGLDLDPPVRLVDVLSRLEREAVLPRIRMSSIEPNEMTREIIDLFAGARNLCHHFHLPMQSGDAGILKAMNRPYGPGKFSDIVEDIRALMPLASIGLDVIAGFPGESPGAFQNTVDLLEKLPLSYFHVFPYSDRPGTPASGFPDHVSPQEIKDRAEILRKMSREKRLRFHQSFLDKDLEILVETKRDPETGMLKGVSRNYIPVLFHGPDAWQRNLRDVTIRSVDEKRALGEACGADGSVPEPTEDSGSAEGENKG